MAMHEFDFEQCGIQWRMLFKMVVQKNSDYQTGADKQIPIFCIPDESDIIVDNSKDTLDKTDDQSLNLTIKPSAFMTFYKVVSDEEISGREVKLTDELMMTLQLEEQWMEDFDIKARYCIASDIVIIDNFCATDTELFPNFYKFGNGYLMSEFGAFRATDLDGGVVLMNFTCILEVCKDECEETLCDDGDAGWGRKKREITPGGIDKRTVASRFTRRGIKSIAKRQAADDVFDIDVGGKVKIVEKYTEIQIVNEEALCLNMAVLIIVLIFLSAGVIGFASTSVVLYRKWVQARDVNRKSEKTGYKEDKRVPSSPHQPVRQFSSPYENHGADSYGF